MPSPDVNLRVLTMDEKPEGHHIVFGADFISAIDRLCTATHVDSAAFYARHGRQGVCDELVRLVRETNAQAFFWPLSNRSFELSPRELERIREQCFTFTFIGDDEHFFEVMTRYYAQAFDLVFTTSLANVGKYEEMGITAEHFIGAFDTKKYKKLDLPRDMDVSFVGGLNKPGRAGFIKALAAKGVDVEVYGSGTKAGTLSHEDMVKVFNRSRINLNFTRLDHTSPLTHGLGINNRLSQIKGRPFEVALCGGFVLSEAAHGLDAMFEVGRELDVFRDADELAAKVARYLEREDEREAMAARAYERARQDYDVDKAFTRILGKVAALASEKVYRPSEIHQDPLFMKRWCTSRLFWCLRFLCGLRLAMAWREFLAFMRHPWPDFHQLAFYLRGGAWEWLKKRPGLFARARSAYRSLTRREL